MRLLSTTIKLISKTFLTSLHAAMATQAANQKTLIGVCQTNAGADREKNFNSVRELIAEAVSRGAKMCFLPESSDYIAMDGQQSCQLAELGFKEDWHKRYCGLARDLKVWLSIGVHLYDTETERTRNSLLMIDDAGTILNIYDKCHLFNVDIPGKVKLSESDHTKMGDGFSDPVRTPAGCVAPMICYDMRFPEMSTQMRQRGAEILTYPSAFTIPTGHAHWEVLLRARAIETQCYVVAAAQCGAHNSKRSSFGHSLVVDPWGTVIARCGGDSPGVITAELDLSRVHELRRSMPVFQHRRDDLY